MSTAPTAADEVASWYERFLERFLAWAAGEQPIRAAIQVGSRARADGTADRWADLDLMLYLATPAAYLERRDWLAALAPVWLALPARTAGGDPELLVTFEGGLNVDFVFCPVRALEWLREHAADDPAFQRGARVLLDRDDAAAGVTAHLGLPRRAPPPSAEAFAHACDAFWYVAVYLARQIRRRDLWLARARDANLREPLLRMIEWHAGVRSGWRADTWHSGRHIERWADPDVLAQLDRAFGGYDADSAARALRASAALFRRLSGEVAAALALQYPAETDARCSALVEDALDT